MTLTLVGLGCRSTQPDRAARFWSGMLGTVPRPNPRGLLVTTGGRQIPLLFVSGSGHRAEQNPLHLHVVRDTVVEQRASVDAAIARGARHLDIGQLPEEDHVVLADPDGNEFCVLLVNSYLAGTGLLGEITCDGTHDVGLFWHDALGWPLVWDRDGETVVQHPEGGTKLAWSGVHDVERSPDDRFYLDLVSDDLDSEISRLTDLGAAVVRQTEPDTVWLADVDGARFRVGSVRDEAPAVVRT